MLLFKGNSHLHGSPMYYELAPDMGIAILKKVASHSLLRALSSFNARQITLEEFLTKRRRVVILRDPIERLKSVFNHYYGATGQCHTNMTEVLSPGIITADGYRLRGGVDQNPHHFTGEVETQYLRRVNNKRAGRRISNYDLSLELDEDDYIRFIDYVLRGDTDIHWMPQLEQITFDGVLAANEIVQIEDLNSWWTANVGRGLMPHENSWIRVHKTEDYELTRLQNFYRADSERRV